MSMGFVKSAYIKEISGGNKMFKKLKDKKGFTLVELIVVLVILAILAALLVPALTGYIAKAREQSLISEGAMVLTAAQATVSEAYGTGDLKVKDGAVTVTNASALKDQINQLAEVKSGASWQFDVEVGTEENYKSIKIKNLIYSDGTNSIAYNKDTNWGSTQKGKKLADAEPKLTAYALASDGTTKLAPTT